MICTLKESNATTPHILSALTPRLGRINGDRHSILRIQRRPSEYYSSFTVEQIEVELAGTSPLRLIFKDVSPRALLAGARHVKPEFLYNPQREVRVYRDILTPAAVGAPTCYAAVLNTRAERYWLLLEHGEGQLLWQFGELGPWCAAARWLANLHGKFTGVANLLSHHRFLLQLDADYFGAWIERASRFVSRSPHPSARAAYAKLSWLAGRYARVVEELAAQPRTLVHNEFYASNVLIETARRTHRVRPVDWEMAGIGPGLIDLAALTAGNWTAQQRTQMVDAYWRELAKFGRPYADRAAFERALDCCRLHIAIQWLGWSPQWTPPREHAQDWLGEAMKVAEVLKL